MTVTSAGWQVTLYNPLWHVSSHSGEACWELPYPVTLLYFLYFMYVHVYIILGLSSFYMFSQLFCMVVVWQPVIVVLSLLVCHCVLTVLSLINKEILLLLLLFDLITQPVREQTSPSTPVQSPFRSEVQPLRKPEVACVTPQMRQPLRALHLDRSVAANTAADDGIYCNGGVFISPILPDASDLISADLISSELNALWLVAVMVNWLCIVK